MALEADWDRQLTARRNTLILAMRRSCDLCESVAGGVMCEVHQKTSLELFTFPRTSVPKYEAVYLGEK